MAEEVSWLGSIDKGVLIAHAPSLVVFEEGWHGDIAQDAKEVAYYISDEFPGIYASTKKPSVKKSGIKIKYWESVKQEFVLFLCKNDKKYNKLKKELNKKAKASASVALHLISMYIGQEIGVGYGAIIGFCAIILYIIGTIGLESFCRYAIQ